MGRFDGQVVFITGVARGQGRNHAIKFASEGAHVVGLDLAGPLSTVAYAGASADDLAETVELVAKAGDPDAILVQGDVRDQDALDSLVDATVQKFGRIDIVLPQAGITTLGKFWELTEDHWNQMIDTNLTGVWRTLRRTIPVMIEGGRGGNIVMTSSIAGLMGMPHAAHYAATKHGVNGIVKTLANELAEYGIRVNSVNPTNCATGMILDPAVYQFFRPDLENPSVEDAKDAFGSYVLLDQPWVEMDEVTDAIAWLCSHEARSITGVTLPVDGGTLVKWPGA